MYKFISAFSTKKFAVLEGPFLIEYYTQRAKNLTKFHEFFKCL